jgi:uncharacterized MAPEG superfamily protein
LTIADLTILAAIVLAIGSIVPAKLGNSGKYNNANPRDPGFYAQGLRARSQGAHLNGFETFPFFAAAVILAEMRHVPQRSVDILAVAFILIRLIFVLSYLADRSTLRSATWFVGFCCNLAIFFLPVWSLG